MNVIEKHKKYMDAKANNESERIRLHESLKEIDNSILEAMKQRDSAKYFELNIQKQEVFDALAENETRSDEFSMSRDEILAGWEKRFKELDKARHKAVVKLHKAREAFIDALEAEREAVEKIHEERNEYWQAMKEQGVSWFSCSDPAMVEEQPLDWVSIMGFTPPVHYAAAASAVGCVPAEFFDASYSRVRMDSVNEMYSEGVYHGAEDRQ